MLYQAPVDDAEANQTFDFPDNITTSKRGTLVVCEDSIGRQLHPRPLRAAASCGTSRSTGSSAASTGLPTRFGDEFAGSTFSPDGHTLFVNIQASRGMTFAIWGPWRKIGV